MPFVRLLSGKTIVVKFHTNIFHLNRCQNIPTKRCKVSSHEEWFGYDCVKSYLENNKLNCFCNNANCENISNPKPLGSLIVLLSNDLRFEKCYCKFKGKTICVMFLCEK